jgi:hypothetical protein
VFGEGITACAAIVHVGPARQSFWALCGDGVEQLRERTRMLPRRREVQLEAGRLRIDDLGIALDVELEEEAGFECLCPHGRGSVWTRKQAGVAARGTLRVDEGAETDIDALAVIDDTAGHHARMTEWWWSAGVGEDADGVAVAWNLVSGVNDPPRGSERAVWIAGSPHEVDPVSFAPDLTRLTAADGSELRFEPAAERSRRENLLIASSDYRAPFGTFSGALPGGVELRCGRGVMEHHRARW